MGVKFRYIKTKVDKKNTVIFLNDCNLCPNLTFKRGDRTAFCIKDMKVIQHNIKRTKIYHNGNVTIDTIVNIPHWCKASKKLYDEVDSRTCTFKSDDNSVIVQFDDLSVKSHVRLSRHTKYDLDGKTLIIDNTKVRNKVHTDVDIPSVETCSHCGKDKEGISRDSNHGMCNTCWDNNKDNNINRYNSFINNFRIKRNGYFKEEKYKIDSYIFSEKLGFK